MTHSLIRNRFAKLLTVVSALALLIPLSAAQAESWLHVRVEEHDRGGEEVNVNIPLSLVFAILPAIDTEGMRDGKIDWHGHSEMEGIDLREILTALRDAPDADYVTVKGPDESVRVAKENGMIVVLVDEDRGDKVRVRLPLQVVDAMLDAGENEFDLVAALEVLSDYGGDIVTVESEDESVRVWIDASATGD